MRSGHQEARRDIVSPQIRRTARPESRPTCLEDWIVSFPERPELGQRIEAKSPAGVPVLSSEIGPRRHSCGSRSAARRAPFRFLLALRWLVDSLVQVAQRHPGVQRLGHPSRLPNGEQQRARCLRRDGERSVGSIEPHLHVGMIEELQQRGPLVARPRLEFCLHGDDVVDETIEFPNIVVEFRLVLCNAGSRVAIDQRVQ